MGIDKPPILQTLQLRGSESAIRSYVALIYSGQWYNAASLCRRAHAVSSDCHFGVGCRIAGMGEVSEGWGVREGAAGTPLAGVPYY
jgi:hypothetical protein